VADADMMNMKKRNGGRVCQSWPLGRLSFIEKESGNWNWRQEKFKGENKREKNIGFYIFNNILGNGFLISFFSSCVCYKS
jgi:hypothetical protein